MWSSQENQQVNCDNICEWCNENYANVLPLTVSFTSVCFTAGRFNSMYSIVIERWFEASLFSNILEYLKNNLFYFILKCVMKKCAYWSIHMKVNGLRYYIHTLVSKEKYQTDSKKHISQHVPSRAPFAAVSYTL